jgi:hypothetical protein
MHASNLSMKLRVGVSALVVATGAVALLAPRDVSLAQDGAGKTSSAESGTDENPKYTADGQLIPFSPEVYRQWVFVGTPLTPNDLNDGDAPRNFTTCISIRRPGANGKDPGLIPREQSW